jgi:phospholipid/cholesterol/gamma-HCH transport system substrate-binding protein
MSKELKIGLIATFLIALLIWGINFLKGKNIFTQTDYYYALYDEIGGMEEASPVYLNGYKIGMVETIRLTGKNNKQIIIKFGIQEKVDIPINSKAIIYSADLMGTKALRMKFTDANEYYDSGDTIPSYFQQAVTEKLYDEVMPIKTKAENLIGALDSILAIFDKETRKSVRLSISNLENTSSNLNSSTKSIDKLLVENSRQINRIIQSTDSITQTISKNRGNINRTIGNMASITDSLKNANLMATLSNLEQTLASTDSILYKINQGNGTAGKLINDDSLYYHLNKTTISLNSLLQDIEENPGRYIHVSVFGKKK